MNSILKKINSGKMSGQHLILIIAVTLTALISGLLYAYSCSVNIGLGKLSNEGYITAMQSINREIQNPLFFLSFMGTLLLLPLSAWLQYRAGASTAFFMLLAATAIYAIGVFGVTMFGNVPLNQTLDKFNLPSASAEEIANQRIKFELPWNRLHTIRTIASVIALILAIIASMNWDNESQLKT